MDSRKKHALMNYAKLTKIKNSILKSTIVQNVVQN